jgi:hypothetical protein
LLAAAVADAELDKAVEAEELNAVVAMISLYVFLRSA